MRKIRVRVVSGRLEGGRVVPGAVALRDGRVWKIDRVLYACPSPDGTYEGIRYTVLVRGGEKYIYRAGRGWYMLVRERRRDS